MSHRLMKRRKPSISSDMMMIRWSLWVPLMLSIFPFSECPNLGRLKAHSPLNLRRIWKAIKKFILLLMESSSNYEMPRKLSLKWIRICQGLNFSGLMKSHCLRFD